MRLTLLLIFAACALAQPPKAVDPIIAEFKKFIASPEATVRRDQVERLARVDTAESVQLLVSQGLSDSESTVRERGAWALAQLESAEAKAAILKNLTHPKAEVRDGICIAIGLSKAWSPAPIAELVDVLKNDKNLEVRSSAASALGQHSAKEATPAFIEALATSRNEEFVIALIDAIALIQDPAAAAPVISYLADASWRVQVAALNALASMRVKESVGPIIEYLAAAEGRPREDASRALEKITKRGFGLNAETWREWWDRVKTDWKVPPATEKGPDEDVPRAGYAGGRRVDYHRITTYSKKIVFIIDISKSMEIPILLKAGVRADGSAAPRTGTPKIAIAREELASALRSMDSETKFNIIAFETDIRFWQKECVPANAGNVQAATKWIMSQKARTAGGGVVASSGVDSDGRIIGRTNTYGALRAAFGLPLKKPSGGTTPSPGGRSPRLPYDTCFFLSDGIPTEGDTTDIDTILRDVAEWNRAAKMVIHAIGMEESAGLQTLLTGLAQQSGGKCVFVGK